MASMNVIAQTVYRIVQMICPIGDKQIDGCTDDVEMEQTSYRIVDEFAGENYQNNFDKFCTFSIQHY